MNSTMILHFYNDFSFLNFLEFNFQNVHDDRADDVEYVEDSEIPLAVSQPALEIRSKDTSECIISFEYRKIEKLFLEISASSININIFFFADSQFKLSYCSKCNETKINCTSKIRTCVQCKTVLKYGCGKCTKLFKTFESLRVHLSQQCNKEPKFFCDKCDYKTLKKIDLTRHKKARHTFGDLN